MREGVGASSLILYLVEVKSLCDPRAANQRFLSTAEIRNRLTREREAAELQGLNKDHAHSCDTT